MNETCWKTVDAERPRLEVGGSCVDCLGQASRGREGKAGVEMMYDKDVLAVWEVMSAGMTDDQHMQSLYRATHLDRAAREVSLHGRWGRADVTLGPGRSW